ncbi:MAG: LytR/AlgR family response regulator transcription factor [Saprospiraceae bacterium]
MNCIIIEDQPPAQRILKKYIEDIGTLQLKATFSNAIPAMDFLKTEEVDLIFLDIHLPKISGIDFLKALPNPPAVILTTAFSEYALESYEFNVMDYLLKPFSFQRFVKAISKIPSKNINQSSDHQENSRKEIFIKSGYEHIKITIDDILYIKSDADYTEIFLSDKKHLSSESLRYWLENLDNNQFMRIHKSYIINISKIEKVVSNQVFLNEKNIIPIGRAYKENFTARFLK